MGGTGWGAGEAARRVVIAGGSGFIGSALGAALRAEGREVTAISRTPGPGRITWDHLARDGLPPCAAVVHLAGAHIMRRDEPWASYRDTVIASRVDTTRALVAAVAAARVRPGVFVSTVGKCLYGPQAPGEARDEGAPSPGEDYPSRLSRAWSQAAAGVPVGVRHVEVRLGIVLAERGDGAPTLGFERGVLPVFRTLVRRCGGFTFGDGRQGFPFVHLADAVALYRAAIARPDLAGPYNAVAPEPATNADLVRGLCLRLGRPVLGRLPRGLVARVVGAERVGILTEGQTLAPRRTLDAGFRFAHPNLDACLNDLLGAVRTPRSAWLAA